ncbi:hypothetical protein ACQ86N_41120 [Puia sp. P3]|uniref:hypothetical protein n=1 Tax=Puia sp. P3 TaxID=3423952 RepID=UPI003D676E9C
MNRRLPYDSRPSNEPTPRGSSTWLVSLGPSTGTILPGLLLVLAVSIFLSWLFCPIYDLGISDKEIFKYCGWAITRGLVPYRDFLTTSRR